MIKQPFIYISMLFTFLAMQLRGEEGAFSSGHLVPVILDAGEYVLSGKSRDGKIQLQNGLILKVLSSDGEKVGEDWEYYEHLSISPACGSSFYVSNMTRKEHARANLYAPPNPDTDCTETIFHIDPFDGQIILKTRTGRERFWQAEEKDHEIMKEWQEGDRVIIGINKGLLANYFSDCKYVMINCEPAEQARYIRVKPY